MWSHARRESRLTASMVALCLAAVLSAPAHAAAPDSDPRAVAIAQQVLKSLGGRERWSALTGVRWTYGALVRDSLQSPRHHAWNALTGAHRIDGVTRSGVQFLFIHTVGDTTPGIAIMNGARIGGDSLRVLTNRAQSLWENDSWWFLMPYRLLDPGTHLRYETQVQDAQGAFDRIAMTLDHGGLTPGDRYWLYVNQKTHRIERWEYVQQASTPPPLTWTWDGWEEHDGLWFATAHRRGFTLIMTNAIQTVKAFPATEFQAP